MHFTNYIICYKVGHLTLNFARGNHYYVLLVWPSEFVVNYITRLENNTYIFFENKNFSMFKKLRRMTAHISRADYVLKKKLLII